MKESAMPYGIFLLKVDFLESKDAYSRALERVSPVRREKAARLKPESDRRLCVGAGLLLEHILDGLGAAGTQRQLEYAPSGKPFLPAFPGVGISVAHSGKYALAACFEGRIGADVQALIPRPEKLFRLLRSDELAFCRDDPERFTRLWALKEACGKYTGEGLGYPPVHIGFDGETPCIPGASCRLYEYPAVEDHFIACCADGDKPPLKLLLPGDVLPPQ